MAVRAHAATSAQWPFWLLLAAWFCASCPQTAVHTAIVWIAEARSFTHQQRLSLEVARVLVREAPSSPIAAAVARTAEPMPPERAPALPAEIALKKIELSLENEAELLPAALRAGPFPVTLRACPEPRRSPPPHGRPRATNAA